MSPHCPHCGAELPAPDDAAVDVGGAPGVADGDVGNGGQSDAIFCPSCGRRVEGWRTGLRASLGGAAAGSTLPGGNEPTRAVEPTESLLRAVALSKAEAARRSVPPDAGASVGLEPVRNRSRAPAVIGALAGLAVVGVVASFVLRDKAKKDPVTAPPLETVPSHAQEPAPSVVTTVPAKKGQKPRRISAPPIAAAPSTTPQATTPPATSTKTRAPVATKVAGGNLPHKAAKTDSRSADVSAQPSGTATPAASGELPVAANETVENEAAPMTEAERRSEAAARADADSVRFVVRARLPQVHACYTRVFKESSPGGRVDIGFLIGPNGRASKIHTEANSTGSTALSTCLEQRIGEWEFPRPASGQFELIYPFIFSPGT